MKATVTVMLKPGVLDPQGKAIGQALHGLGLPRERGRGPGRQGDRAGTGLRPTRPRRGKTRAEEMARQVCWPTLVIESFAVDRWPDHARRASWSSPALTASATWPSRWKASSGQAAPHDLAPRDRTCPGSTWSWFRAGSATATICAAVPWRRSRRRWPRSGSTPSAMAATCWACATASRC